MAVTVADIRKKYPQYSDLSDEQLVQGMHRKFYADLPFEDFAKRVGFSAWQAPDVNALDVAGHMAEQVSQGSGEVLTGIGRMNDSPAGRVASLLPGSIPDPFGVHARMTGAAGEYLKEKSGAVRDFVGQTAGALTSALGFGDDTAEDVYQRTHAPSEDMQRSLQENVITGDITKPSTVSLGTNPTVYGMATNVGGTLARMAPVVAAARVNPVLGAAAGATQGYEGSRSEESDRIDQLPREQIVAMPRFRELIEEETGLPFDQGYASIAAASARLFDNAGTEEDKAAADAGARALQRLKDEAGHSAGLWAAPLGVLQGFIFTGKVGGALASKIRGASAGVLGGVRAVAGTTAGATVGGLGEATTEVAQKVAQAYGATTATGEEGRVLTEDTAADAILGFGPGVMTNVSVPKRQSVTDRVFGGPGIQAGDVLGDVGNDSAPIKAEKGPMTPGGRGYTFDESGNVIEERAGLALPPPEPVPPAPGTDIGPAGPREGADPVDFIVDPEGGPSAPGDWRARAEARRARTGGPGMGPVVDGEPTMAPDDMAQAAFDTAMETAKSAMGRAPSKSSANALASRIAERFGVDPAALIERNRNPVRTQVSPAGGVQPEQQPEIGNEEAGQVGTDGQGQEGQGQALLTPSAAVAAPAAAVAPASPAVEPAPPAEVPRGRMFRQGNNAEAVQAPNGTWYTRRRVAGRWQPWQRRRSFDPSGAHGYSPYQPPSGNVRTPAGVIRVGDDRREAKPTGPRPPNDVIQVIAAAGGINREAARRAGVDPAMLQRRVGIRPLFPINGGMPLNGMRELLTSEGFFPPDDPDAPPTVSDDDAFEIFNRALQGERIVSPNRAAEEAAYQESQRSAGTAQAEDSQPTAETQTDDDERLAAEFLSRVESDPVARRVFDDLSAEEDAEAMAIVDLAERAMQLGATPAEVRQAYNAQGDAEMARNLWELIRTKEIANGPDAREGQARDRNGDQAQPGGLEAARDAAQRQPAAGNEGASASRPVESVGQAESEEVTRLRGEVSRLRRELDTDSLTGVKSRSAYSRDNPKAKGVAFIDVIAFKGYNTKFTETGGDAVLQAFGRVMLEVAGEQAYRRGGDEFAILSSESPEHAREIAKRVFDAMAQERLLLVDKEGVEYEIAGIPFRTGIGATDAEATADSAARKLAGDRESNPNVQRRASDADVGRSGAVPGPDVRGQGGVPGRQEDRGLTNEPQSDDQAGGRDGQGASAAVERGEAAVRGDDPGRGERAGSDTGRLQPVDDRGIRNDGLAQAGPGRADAAPVATRQDDDTPADPLALSDETAVTPPPAAPRPPSQNGLFGQVTPMDVDRLNYERAQSEARTDPSRAPRPPASDTVDIEQQIARETKTPPEGGVSVSGVDAAGRQRITPDIAANLKPGDVVVDEDGNEYRAHAARHDWLEAHPIKDGKAVVNADTRVTFLLTPEKASAYPERRNVPIYATGRNLDEAIGGRAAGAAAAQASKIEDFGEKIGGARKDTWRGFRDRLTEVSDDDIITEPLSKTWPQPDYQKLIDEGADSWAVGFMRAARDEIPRKPSKAWKQRAWADQVKMLRDVSLSLLDGSISVERAKEKLNALGSRGMRELASRVELYELVGHEKSLEGVSFAERHYSLYKGRENVHMWVVEKETTATAFSNWPRELATGSTKDEALQAFKEKIGSLQLTPEKSNVVTFDIYSYQGVSGYMIGKKVGRNHIDLAGPFKTVGEARAHRDANNAALTEKLEAAKQIPNERRETNEPRVGADMRNGQDVTPQMFGDAFGFRGVEFGNWVDQKKRQNDLNEAFDALMDMAAILGIPPRAISLNGQLGIAFGARGSGGVNPAAAHYEPTSVVINLTKKNGAGSLGHEWWHALDNYFSRMRGKGGAYATEALDVSLASRGSRFAVGDARVRKEMIEAFGKVVSAINSTAIRARSAKLDARRSKEYWTTGREMAARAFESYLITKLQDQNASNDYLANIVDEATWAAAEKLGFELDESYPYPTAGEIPAISAAFDRFFNTIETRETDDGKVEIRENQAQYSGHAAGVPAAVRESTPESGKPGLRRDVQPGTSVPVQLDIFDVAGSRPITLRERADLRRRFADVRTGELKSGIDRVTSLADAAHIFAPLRKHAVEQFMALVLGVNGKPLRVIRHSIGTRDGAGVYAETIVPQIAGTQGAHSVVFAHNHPSGSIEESTADIAVTNRLVAALEGSGIGVMGHVIVAPGSKVARIIDDGGLSRKTEITTARRSGAVPVVESMQRKAARGEAKWVSDPRSAITIASEWGNHGVILLNTRHEVIGTIAMSSDEMSALRDSDSDGSPRARNLLAAIADANASAVIVVSQDEKAGKNVATMFDRTKSARVLDVLVDDGETKKSLAGTVSGFYLPGFASNPAPGWEFAGTDTDTIAESVLQAEIAKARAEFGDGVTITVLDTIADAPASDTTKRLYPGAHGLTDGKSNVWIFRKALQGLQALRTTLAHEIIGHIGVERAIGDAWPQVMAAIKRIREGKMLSSVAITNAVRSAESRYPKADDLTFAREAVAIMAESGVTGDLWDRIVSGVRATLRRIFKSLQWSDAEIRNLLRRAGEAARKPAVFKGAEFEAAQVSDDQRDITETPEFKRWFGDSKVVDADGKPLVVYHGSNKPLDRVMNATERMEKFDKATKGLPQSIVAAERRAVESTAGALWFTSDEGVAEGYAGQRDGEETVTPVYLSMQNPLNLDDMEVSEVERLLTNARGRAVEISTEYGRSKGIAQAIVRDSGSLIQYAKESGYDGLIYPDTDVRGRGLHTSYVTFSPGQIKSATGNRGTFDPNDPSILASNPAQGPIERKMADDARAGQPIDKLFRLPFHLFGLDSHGRLKPGTKLYDWLTRVVAEKMPAEDGAFGWAIPIIKSVRSGLIDRYGVPQDFVLRDERRESEVRSVLMHAARVAADLEGLTTAEAKVLQAMLTGQEMPVGELGKLSQPIKEAIDQMGREAVELGLISPEAYERNRGAYLHRSYLKYEADRTPLGKAIGSFLDKRRKKLLGDTLRRRGMTMERDTGALAAALGGAVREGDTVTVLRQKTEAGGVRTKYQRGPLNGPAPVGWENLGDWRVMGFDGKKAKLWRDFTPAEREKMGEILDARYNITKTFALMAHDLATGRFLRDIAANPDWARADLPEGATAAEARGRYDTYADSEWVRVPDAAIPGTNDGKGNPVKRWGELAGMYVRAPIWRDLNQLREMQNPQVWGSVWNKVLTFWKTNKTARNPVVHVNNVMSNMMFMDLADIRLRDLYRAIGAWRRGESDDDYRDAMANGAFGGGFADQELKRKVLQPILDDILAKQKTDGQDTAEDRLGVLHLLSTIWDGIKKVDGKMLDAYNAEDEIFRLAFYLRRQSLGDTPEEAARAARRQFIDYDIRAPLVNAARNTVLPFIGYTYRSIPILAQAIAERPWKLAKYATLAAAANWLGYLFAPGDEDDERKVMSPAVQGNTWTGTPRMIRMPWYDADGNPVFLDVRRWIPAGDVFDMNQSETGLPSWLQFGGPLQIAGELMLNKQAFTKQPIVDPLTDTTGEKAAKLASWGWKAFAPNAPWIPESYSWDKIAQAITGETDVMGRDFSAIEAASSTLGIKAAGHDVDLQRRYRIREFDKVERELDFDKAMLKRELSTKAITRERFDANMARIIEKEKRLNEKRREVLAR